MLRELSSERDTGIGLCFALPTDEYARSVVLERWGTTSHVAVGCLAGYAYLNVAHTELRDRRNLAFACSRRLQLVE